MRKLRKVVCLVLIFCILCSSVVSADVGSNESNSSGRVQAFLNIASGKTNIDDSFKDISFTKPQLRFMGVFISNYFVPFSTELGMASGDDSNKSIEAVKKALTTGLKFTDAYADMFSEEILGLSRASVENLEFRASAQYQQDYLIPDEYYPNGNYYNFLTSMLGTGDEMIDSLHGNCNLVKQKEDLKYGYWGFMDNGNFIPVADCSLIDGNKTAFQVAFLNCLKNVPYDNGYGYNVFDLTSEEAGKDIAGNLSDSQYLELSINGMKMQVDCFGNIIINGYQHQLVAVPGCVNPYTWQAVSSDGTDILKPGEAYNLINIPSMSAADNGKGTGRSNLYKNISISEKNTQTSGGVSESAKGDTLKTGILFNSDSQLSMLCLSYIKSHKSGKADQMMRDLKYILGYSDGIKGNNDWVVNYEQVSDKEVVIKATNKVSVWETVNVNKLKSSFHYKDKEKHKKLEDCFKRLREGNGHVPGLPRDKIISSISNTKSYVLATANDGSTNQGTSEDGRTNVILKQVVPNFAGFNPNSELAIHRGTSDTDLDGKVFGHSNFQDAYTKAMQQYLKVYSKDKSVYLNDWLKEGSSDVDMKIGSNTVNINVGNIDNSNSIYLMDTMVMIDSLGTYHFDTSETNVDYNAFKAINYITDEEGSTINSNETWKYGENNNFSAGYTDIKDGTIVGNISVDESAVVSIYSTYVLSSLYDNSRESMIETIGKIGFKMNSNGLPLIPNEPLNITNALKGDIMLTRIRDWVYYLLHPEFRNYAVELIKNTVNSFLLNWHEEMVGTKGSGNMTGSTLYRPTTGYVTTPDLSEMEWTDTLIDFYNDSIPFLIIVMVLVMLLSFISGMLSVQQCIFGVVLFALFLLIPVNLINTVVGVSNRVSEGIYGEKFTYWALVQQESYGAAIDKVANGDSYTNYLQTLYSKNNEVFPNQGSESIVMKWQAPKKMVSLMYEGDSSYSSLSSEGQEVLSPVLDRSFSGEIYLNDESLYMYRSYLDISNYSQYIYRSLKEGRRDYQSDLNNDITGNFSYGLQESVKEMSDTFQEDISRGYTNPNKNGDTTSSGLKVVVPLSSSIVNNSLPQQGTVADMGINEYVGINPDLFNFGIPVFNNGNVEGEESTAKPIKDYILESVSNSSTERQENLEASLVNVSERDLTGLAGYSLYSENPFYYFSWCLYDQGLEPSMSIRGNYKNLLLDSSNGGYFYNTLGNGELKDFMDMRSLFTYIIPYLKQCNDIVTEWDSINGLFLYEGIPYEEGHWEDEAFQEENPSYLEMRQKYWHNLNVMRLYSLYTPWVDIMYDTSYAKAEKINVMGKTVKIVDPINPSSYPEERPMVFSHSEMNDYGLDYGDLTTVEKKILETNEGMQERMYELLNYYTFSDVTMNTAAAMNCAFEFNKNFSESGLFSDNHNIYPQSFNLNDFSYDAFLRFILSNTTGEDMSAGGDFYANVVKRSSTTTAILMVVTDFVSVYVLPIFKLFFIVAMFISSILIILCIAFKIDSEQKYIKTVLKSIILPNLKYALITIGFSFVISLFMGTGYNAITKSKQLSIKLGEPVSAMLVLVVIDIVVLILYGVVIFRVLKDVIHNAKQVFTFVRGAVSGAVSKVVNIFNNSNNTTTSNYSNVDSFGSEGTNGYVGNANSGYGRVSNVSEIPKEDDRSEFSSTSDKRQNDTRQEVIDNIKEDENEELNEEERKEEINSKMRNGSKKVNNGLEDK